MFHRTLKLLFGCILLSFLSACFTVENQIFLNADGTGDAVFYVSVSDFPAPRDKDGKPASVGSSKNPKEEFEHFKLGLTSHLPMSIVLKEAKEIKQNGIYGFYAVLHFNDLGSLETIFSELSKPKKDEKGPEAKTEFSAKLEKKGEQTLYKGKFLLFVPEMMQKKSDKKSSKKDEGSESQPSLAAFESEANQLILGALRFRFTLHTPTPIIKTNADIVLNDTTAIWDGSAITFVKNPRPIEMTASF